MPLGDPVAHEVVLDDDLQSTSAVPRSASLRSSADETAAGRAAATRTATHATCDARGSSDARAGCGSGRMWTFIVSMTRAAAAAFQRTTLSTRSAANVPLLRRRTQQRTMSPGRMLVVRDGGRAARRMHGPAGVSIRHTWIVAVRRRASSAPSTTTPSAYTSGGVCRLRRRGVRSESASAAATTAAARGETKSHRAARAQGGVSDARAQSAATAWMHPSRSGGPHASPSRRPAAARAAGTGAVPGGSRRRTAA